MKTHRLAPLAIAVFAGTLTLVAVAASASSPPVRASDPTGDNQTAPDVTGLAVRQEGERIVTEIAVADRTNKLETGEFLVFFVDSDANAATGNKDGADYVVEYEQTAAEGLFRVYRWSTAGGQFAFDKGFNASFGTGWGRLPSPSGTLRVFFKPKLFGIAAKLDVYARSESAGAGDDYTFDRVPDTGSLSLALSDRTAPVVKAHAGAARAGTVAKLRYQVSDASGQTREIVSVRKGGTALSTLRSKLHATVAGKTYTAVWRVPASAKGALRFCVQALDAAGNSSAPSCARLTVS
jgi:hypothetical protein